MGVTVADDKCDAGGSMEVVSVAACGIALSTTLSLLDDDVVVEDCAVSVVAKDGVSVEAKDGVSISP